MFGVVAMLHFAPLSVLTGGGVSALPPAEAQAIAEEMSAAVGRPASLCEVRRVYENPIAFGAPSGLDHQAGWESEPA